MKKKILALALVFCLALALGIGGTLAYLTSTDTVKNTFTVGNVSIKLDEAKTNINGEIQRDENGKEQRTETTNSTIGGNSYKLMPGHTYAKDPTVTVKAGSESAYIKMVVTVNKASALDKIFKDHNITDLNTVIDGYAGSEWTLHGTSKDTTKDTRTYEFWYKEAVDASKSATDIVLDDLFESIKVPDGLTNDELATLYTETKNDDNTTTVDQLTITVTAHAIQADGFADAAAAWAAYNK